MAGGRSPSAVCTPALRGWAVSGRRSAISMGRPAGRNDLCPCGSGRKFKFCCVRLPAEIGAIRPPPPGPRTPSPATPATVIGEPAFGPLTEVAGLRRMVEEFRLISPDLLATAGSANPVPRHRQLMAQRHRERGAKLVASGRLAAAITAFTEAARLDPRNAAVHYALGRALLDAGRLDEAINSLQLAAALRDDAATYHSLAIALTAQRDAGTAAAAYRRAIELAPGLVAAHVGLADLLQTMWDDEAAAASLRCAAALLPDHAEGLCYLARALLIEGDFSAAARALRRASELDPTDSEVIKRLGDVLVRQGHFAAAAATFERALALEPRHARVHFALAEIGRCTVADRPRLALLGEILSEVSLGDEERMTLHFAAGKMYDDLGEYEAAMQHFDAANQIRGRRVRFDSAALAVDIDRLVSRFTSEFFTADRPLGSDDETPLLIVGLPRSGTTLVEQVLSRHRDICGGGEYGFWVRQAAARGTLEPTDLTPEMACGLAQQYLGLLRRDAPGAARVTDKLPFNVLHLGLIHALLPKARIIQCRRHPVDTCLSMYFTNFQQPAVFLSDKGALAAAYRQYARLMNHWREVLPPDRFFEVEYERLVSDCEAVTRELIAFTGLEWDEACLRPEQNPRPVMTASVWQARQPVYTTSIARWRHYQPWLGELGQLLTSNDTALPQSSGGSG
jgi:tetratricopeptide (TPR) repeat protein